MLPKLHRYLALLFGVALAPDADAVLFGGVDFPAGEVSFADAIVSYTPGPGSGGFGSPLGPPGGGYISIGTEGELVLAFTDNSLTTSGDDAPDLYIFEAGSLFEAVDVFIGQNTVDWIGVGSTTAATGAIDIDAFIGAGVIPFSRYSYVRIVDLLPEEGGFSGVYGAEIDAVGAISSAPPVPESATGVLLALGLAALALRRTRVCEASRRRGAGV